MPYIGIFEMHLASGKGQYGRDVPAALEWQSETTHLAGSDPPLPYNFNCLSKTYLDLSIIWKSKVKTNGF